MIELSIQQKEEIKDKFLSIKDVDNFVVLLNFANEILHPLHKETKTVELQTLNYYLYHKKDRYHVFSISKKTGGKRVIKSPDHFLKSIQKIINLCLSLVFLPILAAHGFVKQRNIVTNAQNHVNKKYLLNLDLKDFFTSVNFGRVNAVLGLAPFNFPEKITHILANLACDEGCLPQGSPSSPIITNLICRRLDKKLVDLGKKYRFYYTRYADDLTFSSNYKIFDEDLIEEIKIIIIEEGFEVNNKKQRLQTSSMRQEVTGLVVNQKVNVNRKYIKKVRAMLHSWENEGYYTATQIFEKQYTKEKIKFKNKQDIFIPLLDNALVGKIEFIGMVRGKQDKTYLTFKEQIGELLAKKDRPLSYEEIMDNLNTKMEQLFSQITE